MSESRDRCFVNTLLSELEEALPSSLIDAYIQELRAPVRVSGDRGTSQRLSALLGTYADSLDAAQRSSGGDVPPRPSFPGKTGVTDTFAYIGHFLPIAAIVGVVELIFPLTLWLYTFFDLRADVLRASQSSPRADEDEPDDPAPDDEAPRRRGRPRRSSASE